MCKVPSPTTIFPLQPPSLTTPPPSPIPMVHNTFCPGPVTQLKSHPLVNANMTPQGSPLFGKTQSMECSNRCASCSPFSSDVDPLLFTPELSTLLSSTATTNAPPSLFEDSLYYSNLCLAANFFMPVLDPVSFTVMPLQVNHSHVGNASAAAFNQNGCQQQFSQPPHERHEVTRCMSFVQHIAAPSQDLPELIEPSTSPCKHVQQSDPSYCDENILLASDLFSHLEDPSSDCYHPPSALDSTHDVISDAVEPPSTGCTGFNNEHLFDSSSPCESPIFGQDTFPEVDRTPTASSTLSFSDAATEKSVPRRNSLPTEKRQHALIDSMDVVHEHNGNINPLRRSSMPIVNEENLWCGESTQHKHQQQKTAAKPRSASLGVAPTSCQLPDFAAFKESLELGIIQARHKKKSKTNAKPVAKTATSKPAKIPRPPNAFIIYRRTMHQTYFAKSMLTNVQFSQWVAAQWKALSSKEKKVFIDAAEEAKEEHREMYPDYKYTPKRRRCTSIGSMDSAIGMAPMTLDESMTLNLDTDMLSVGNTRKLIDFEEYLLPHKMGRIT